MIYIFKRRALKENNFSYGTKAAKSGLEISKFIFPWGNKSSANRLHFSHCCGGISHKKAYHGNRYAHTIFVFCRESCWNAATSIILFFYRFCTILKFLTHYAQPLFNNFPQCTFYYCFTIALQVLKILY